MFEQYPEALQQKVKALADEALSQANPSGWFEPLYEAAQRDTDQVPWAHLTLHPHLQDWLDQAEIQGQGRTALVIGCGLGDDAETLQAQGFQVTAFDIAPTAIAWCHQRFPDSAVTYCVADVLAVPAAWQQGFDLVVESRTIQALPLTVRSQVIQAIAPLVAVNGTLLVLTRLRDTETEPEGPPWPLSERELSQFESLGLHEVRRQRYTETDPIPVTKVRIEYQHVIRPMRTLTKWSVADYQHMRNVGILDHHHCELINGEIWEMSPEGEVHRFINHRGVNYLREIMKGQAEIFEAHPITLAASEPEPDISIVRLPDTRYLKHHPYPEDIYWLVEVADTTLTYDLGTKRKLYAQAGIREYWVIDVAGRQLTLFRDLRNGDFSTQNTIGDGMIYPIAFPAMAIEIHKLVRIPE